MRIRLESSQSPPILFHQGHAARKRKHGGECELSNRIRNQTNWEGKGGLFNYETKKVKSNWGYDVTRSFSVQGFTNNHELAAKALRLPVGTGAFSSPYLALLDLMKRWPSTADRRSILLISSGIDYFRGNFPSSPDVDSTFQRAQKQNINIWSIYAPDAEHRSRGFFRAFRGQSDLIRLAEETGAESYYLGTRAPVSFKPYLDELAVHLANQYLLTFKGNGGAKGRFERVRITTELPHVEFLAAPQVFLPAVQ